MDTLNPAQLEVVQCVTPDPIATSGGTYCSRCGKWHWWYGGFHVCGESNDVQNADTLPIQG